MPTCKTCKQNFSRTVMVEGQKKILSGQRTRCLNCSPFAASVRPDYRPARQITCKKCHKVFTAKQILSDGQKVNLGMRRVFCLECSPYGKGNSKDLSRTDQLFPVVNGKRYFSAKGKEYINAKNYWKSKNRKMKLVAMKGGCCLKCGYNKCLRSLEFHHRNPKEKKFGLNYKEMMHRPWNSIVEEVKKCDLLCGNCHGETHDNHIYDELYAKYKDRFSTIS